MLPGTLIHTRMNARDWTMLIALSVLWGGTFFFVGVAVSELAPFTIIATRVSLAAAALWLVSLAASLRPPRSWRAWRAFLVMGTINNVIPFSLIVWGQTQIASGLASILNATTPLFTVVVAGVFLQDEKISLHKAAGVIVGMAGVILMIGPSALEGLGAETLARVAVVGAAVSYAFGGVYGRRFKQMELSPITTAVGQLTASSLILVPVALLMDRPFSRPSPSAQVWAVMIGLALLSTALAYVLYFRILASAGATNLLLVTFLIPVSAIFLGSLVLQERLETIHFIGMFMIGVGLSFVDGRLWTRRSSIPERRAPT